MTSLDGPRRNPDPGFRRERVVTIGLPAPLTLMEPLLKTVGRWHDGSCERPGCQLMCTGDEKGNWELFHRWPVPGGGGQP